MARIRRFPNLDRFCWLESRESLCGEELKKFYSLGNYDKSNAYCLRGRGHSRIYEDDAKDLYVSLNNYGDGFFDDALVPVTAMSQGTIRLKDEKQRFFEIFLGFGERLPLRVDAGDLLNVADVPLAFFHVDCGKLSDHCNLSIAYEIS